MYHPDTLRRCLGGSKDEPLHYIIVKHICRRCTGGMRAFRLSVLDYHLRVKRTGVSGVFFLILGSGLLVGFWQAAGKGGLNLEFRFFLLFSSVAGSGQRKVRDGLG